jgi:peptide chain release factor 1
LAPIRTVYEQIKSYEDSIKDIQEMMKETKDESEKKLLQEEMDASKEKLLEIREEIWDLLIPAAKYDNASDIILELRPGAGGAESSIFVKDISEMYESYCSTQGWKCWITGSAK